MQPKSLDSIFSSFDPSKSSATSELKDGGAVTIWLPAKHKAAYDQLQRSSGRNFCKKLRELIEAAIEVAEERSA